jgi:hypothetical protein
MALISTAVLEICFLRPSLLLKISPNVLWTVNYGAYKIIKFTTKSVALTELDVGADAVYFKNAFLLSKRRKMFPKRTGNMSLTSYLMLLIKR